jgi:hypothetical protein
MACGVADRLQRDHVCTPWSAYIVTFFGILLTHFGLPVAGLSATFRCAVSGLGPQGDPDPCTCNHKHRIISR